MGKKFNQFLRNAARLGIYVGDINQATTAYQGGGYPTDPATAPQPAPMPVPKKPPTIIKQERTTVGQSNTGVRTKQKQRKERMNIGKLRIQLDQSGLVASGRRSTPHLG
jgi:hypothetical protein